jgi:hypothetical protein
MYRVFEPAKFAKGERHIIWDGVIRKQVILLEFLYRYVDLAEPIRELMRLFNIFLIRTDCDRRTRLRIEAAIARAGGDFQDKDIRYIHRLKGEPLMVASLQGADVLGLPTEIEY